MFERSVIMNCDSPVAKGWPDYSLLTVAVDPKPSSSKPVSSWVHDLNVVEQRGAFIELQLDQAYVVRPVRRGPRGVQAPGVRLVADLEPVWSADIPAAFIMGNFDYLCKI